MPSQDILNYQLFNFLIMQDVLSADVTRDLNLLGVLK